MNESIFISLVLKAWGMTAGLMLILWLVQVKTRNAGILDVGWACGLGLCAILYADTPGGLPLRKTIITAMVCMWAARLSFLLLRRILGDPAEDRRYHRMREEWKTHVNFKFFLMFEFQALLDVVLSWGFLLICANSSPILSAVEIFGIALWVTGFFGEAAADEQLHRFKSEPANKGKTCDTGLWYYSRHPNYFFEWLMWVGYFVMALPGPWGWTSIVGPAFMLHFLINVTGVPMAEQQSLKTKGEEYRRYQQSTSMFIPWLKRKI